MAKKPKEPPSIPPPATLSDSFSSSREGSSPPPSFSPVKKPSAASTVTVLPKHTEPSSVSVDREEEDEDEGSESEEVSPDEESSEDSQAANDYPNPLSQLRESRSANGKQASNSHHSSDSCSEYGEEAGEEQQPLLLTQATGNTDGIKSEAIVSGSISASGDESLNSSDSNMIVPPRSSSRNIAGPSLKPLSSKPMGSPAQLADHNILSGKRSATPSDQIAEKKRKTADVVGTEGGQEKKEISRKYWSKAEELSLLQCILNYKKYHHAIPCTEVQLEYLLKALNDSLSIPATLNQLILKIRRLKLKYFNTTKKVKGAIFNAHDASVFDKSRNIWGGSGIHDVVAFDKLKKIGVSGKDDSCFIDLKIKGKKHFAEGYPFLYWHVKSEHPNNALVHGDYVPITEAKDLEGSCKKLEIAEIQLHMQKIKLLPSALKLIEEVLAKK